MENLLYSFLIAAIGVVIASLGCLYPLRRAVDQSPFAPTRLTKNGWIYLILSVALIILLVYKIKLDYVEKQKQDNEKSVADSTQKVFRDSVYSSFRSLLLSNGLFYDQAKNKVIVSDQRIFYQSFHVGASVPARHGLANSDQNQVNVERPHTSVDSNKQSPSVVQPNPVAATAKRDYKPPIDDEITYPDVDLGGEGKEMNGNTGSFNAYGRCKFVNGKKVGITLYYGACISNNIGISKGVVQISPGRSGSSDPLLIGFSSNGGPVNPSTARFEFYFVTNDEGQPKKYGKIAVKITALKESKIYLDDSNLILTVGGAREVNFLRYAGISP